MIYDYLPTMMVYNVYNSKNKRLFYFLGGKEVPPQINQAF